MANCPGCAAEVNASDVFCPRCGTETAHHQTAQAVAAAPIAAQKVDGAQSLLKSLIVFNGGEIFDDASGFDWAAFFWGFVWAFFRGQWKIGLTGLGLAFVFGSIPFVNGIVGLVYCIALGTTGYTLAAAGSRPGRYASFEQLKQAERPWAMAGLVVVGIAVVLGVLGVLVSAFLGGMAWITGY